MRCCRIVNRMLVSMCCDVVGPLDVLFALFSFCSPFPSYIPLLWGCLRSIKVNSFVLKVKTLGVEVLFSFHPNRFPAAH